MTYRVIQWATGGVGRAAEVEKPPGALEHPRKTPTVKALVWPHGNELCKWEVLPETNQLKVYTDTTWAIGFGVRWLLSRQLNYKTRE